VYIGQEAVAVGCTQAVKPEDPIITAYRDHGHALAGGMTYRDKVHEMSDPRKYRTREEEERYESNDAIAKFEKALIDHGVVTEESVKEMLKGVREEVRDSIQFSNESPEPPLSDLYTDVFVEPWGRYTGSSLPEFMGGADNVCGFRSTDGKEGLV
ncbi:MAG: thiamine pyrophosphate-dependent enzyme, partial [bacterium]